MKRPKFRNIVWLDLSLQQKLFQVSDKLSLPPNVIIAEILKFVFNNGKLINEFISAYKVKEELPIKYFIKCPVCGKKMELERIKTHVRVAHDLEIEEVTK